MTGWQAVPSDKTPDNFGQTVNGNYAFADMNYDPDALAAEAPRGSAEGRRPRPADHGNPLTELRCRPSRRARRLGRQGRSVKAPTGKAMYKPTTEEDINVFDGDVRMPQENYPLPASTSRRVPSPTRSRARAVRSRRRRHLSPAPARTTRARHSQGFKDAGGSPYEGLNRPLCDAKVISTAANQTVAPNFNFFTDVPLPTHFWGLTINDLGLTHDKQPIGYGEAQGLPNVPWASTTGPAGSSTPSAPTTTACTRRPSLRRPRTTARCPRVPAPDVLLQGERPRSARPPEQGLQPAVPDDRHQLPGVARSVHPTDTAPTQTAALAITPDGAIANPVACDVNAGVTDPANATPDIYAVDNPTSSARVSTRTPTPPSSSRSRECRRRARGRHGRDPDHPVDQPPRPHVRQRRARPRRDGDGVPPLFAALTARTP